MSRQQFISLILDDERPTRPAKKAATDTAAGEGVLFDASLFGETPPTTSADDGIGFARTLLEGSGFGDGRIRETAEVILGDNPAKRSLPQSCWLWPKTSDRPHRTLLFQLENPGSVLLEDGLFRDQRQQKRLEDALHRLIQTAQQGFAVGGGKRTADVEQGKPEETLILVSVDDDRKRQDAPVTLVCFGTVTETTGAFEAFHITNEARQWAKENRALAEDHLSRLYYRHFEKLASETWQDAFVTGKERDLARKLLDVCTAVTPDAKRIEETAVKLIRQIAMSFGRGHQSPKIEFDLLPKDHFIGADPKAAERPGFENDFSGMTVRDGRERLLGYIVYCLDEKRQADRLRTSLAKNNSFHNVLVIYPDGDGATLELWQGRRSLKGKLTKAGAQFRGEGEVVNLLSRFFVVSKSEIAKPEELAQDLAHRAKYLKLIALGELEREQKMPKSAARPVLDLYELFDKSLMRQSEGEFADTYAQTLTYCLLAARWTGKDTKAAFSLANVTGLLAGTGGLLTGLFEKLLALRVSPRLGWLIEDLVSLLHRTAVHEVFSNDDQDPVIHFYEPFLAAYDKELKNKRGVFYTPQPVVSYIVRSVHELLQTEFGLADGLADTTTWGAMLKKHPGLKLPPLTDEPGEKHTISPDEPFVQILDPATGTATFLVEVIEVIHRTLVAKWKQQRLTDAQQRAAWNNYVPQHLLPRLHAFELMMAPYAIAHMKIGLKLAETGYRFGAEERARIYLTNALEPWVKQLPLIGFDALAHEAAAVNEIKHHSRFTIVIGNPPYSGESSNNGEWISSLIRDYHYVDGQPLGEANPRWLQDDYVKFIRLAQRVVTTTGCGVVGLITNHAYLDNATFRGARQSLLNSFSHEWFFDLHGNTKKKERHPDGSLDVNVFEIQQGVAISILTKSESSRAPDVPDVKHSEIFGTREAKNEFLGRSTFSSTEWRAIAPIPPFYLFIPQNQTLFSEYQRFHKITEIMPVHSNGIVTARDHFCIGWSPEEAWNVVREFCHMKPEEAREHFHLGEDSRDWQVRLAQADARKDGPSRKRVVPIYYRPFDTRWTYFTGRSRGYLCMPRGESMSNMLTGKNLALITSRMTKGETFQHVQATRCVSEAIVMSPKTSNNGFIFPLYLLPDKHDSDTLAFRTQPELNFAPTFVRQLAATLNVAQTKPHGLPAGLTPEDIFHYAYAVLHSPGYRSRYAEFLKIDFPRLPLTGNLELFCALARLGGELTALHLLESKTLDKPRTKFIGDNRVLSKVGWTPDNGGTVWLDGKGAKGKNQSGNSGFASVPEEVWNFHIGGYQVCEKWLKDRGPKRGNPGRTLTADDIALYQKIVVAISETIRIMKEIDKTIHKHGGWPGSFVTKPTGGKK